MVPPCLIIMGDSGGFGREGKGRQGQGHAEELEAKGNVGLMPQLGLLFQGVSVNAKRKGSPPQPAVAYDMGVWTGGNDPVVPMHSEVFAWSSPVFDSLLQNRFKMSSGGRKTVPLQIEQEVFKLIKEFIYNEKFDKELSMQMLLKLLKASVQYEIERLTLFVKRLVMEKLTPLDAFKLLEMARSGELPELGDFALKIIAKNAENLLQTNDFTALGLSDVSTILSNDDLQCNEVIVFTAVVRWAKRKAANSVDKGRAFQYYYSQVEKLVPFHLMSQDDLMSSGLLDDAAIVKILPHGKYAALKPVNSRLSTSKRTLRKRPLDKTTNDSGKEDMDSDSTLILSDVDVQSEPLPVSTSKRKLRKRSSDKTINDLAKEDMDSDSTLVLSDVDVQSETLRVSKSKRTARKRSCNKKISDSGKVKPVTEIEITKPNRFSTFEEMVDFSPKLNDSSGAKPLTTRNYENITLDQNYKVEVNENLNDLKIVVNCHFLDKPKKVGKLEGNDILDSPFLQFITKFDIRRYIRFDSRGGVPPLEVRPDNLWYQQQDILLKINGVTFLKLEHAGNGPLAQNTVVLNYMPDSKQILSNKSLIPTNLALSNCEFSMRHFKKKSKELQVLILHRVWGDYSLDDIMKESPKLRELICWKYVPSNWIQGSPFLNPLCMNFANAFAAKSCIRKLVLSFAELKFPLRCSNVTTSVQDLVLERCYSEKCSNKVGNVFQRIFPKLETLVILEDHEESCENRVGFAVSSLLNCVIRQIRSIRSITVIGMKWGSHICDKELHKFLVKKAKIANKPRSFRIGKMNNAWNSTALDDDDKTEKLQQMDGGHEMAMKYSLYQLHNFFDTQQHYQDYMIKSEHFPCPRLF